MEKWLKWAIEIQSLAQSGLAYTNNVYDIERYEKLREISAEMIAEKSNLNLEKVKDLFCNETGYQTPKIDTRAVIFKDNKILLTHENNGTWALPGGWCDVLESVESNTIKEANGNLAFNIVIKDTIEDSEKLKEAAEATGIEIKSSQDCINYIIDSLNGETAKSDLEKLAKLDLIEIKSLNKDYASYDSVVLVGENEDENMKNSFELKEKNIISKLKSEKKYLVAVQREESTSEFIKLCSDLNI